MRLSNVILRVRDLERSQSFYERLGLATTGANEAMVFLDAGSCRLALTAGEDVDPGDSEMVFEVEDIDEAHRRLSGTVEFRVEPRPVTVMGDQALWAADFRDPDGHVVSITAWKAAE